MIAWLSWSSVKCSNAAAASAAAAAADDDDDDGAAAAAVGAAAAADVADAGAGAGADADADADADTDGSADADADGSSAVAMPADDTDSEDLPVMTVFKARIGARIGAESRRRSDFGGVKPLEPSSCLDRCGLSLILLGLRANRGRDSTTRRKKSLLLLWFCRWFEHLKFSLVLEGAGNTFLLLKNVIRGV